MPTPIFWDDTLTAEKIAKKFPGMSIEKIYAAITYYHANREAIDEYLEQGKQEAEDAYQAWLNNPSPPPVVQRLRALKAEKV